VLSRLRERHSFLRNKSGAEPSTKPAFVAGFAKAVKASLSNEDKKRYLGQRSVSDEVRALDLFYRDDPGYSEFPIWLGIHCVNLLESGTTDEQIPDVLEAEGIWRRIALGQ
jgi:hypothetical protein